MKKNLTARQFLKFKSSDLLGGGKALPALSDDERWQQAVFARTVRNFWFTASAQPPGSGSNNLVVTAQSPRFSEPIIVTDLLSMFDFKSDDASVAAMFSRYRLKLFRYGSHDAASGVELFGTNSYTGAEFITKHEKNRSTAVTITGTNPIPPSVFDTQAKYLPFVPRLLEPYDFIEARWMDNNPITDFSTGLGLDTDGWPLQIGFRSVRVLQVDNPYRYFTRLAEKQIKNYIAGNQPETFFLEVTFPFAKIPPLAVPLSVPFTIKTPEMGRPLMVLGCATNLEGCQAGLYSEEDYYNFTYLDKQKRISSLALVAPVEVPMSLWCPDTDFRNTNMFNMWPVPHVMEPGAQFSINIWSGQVPFSGAGSFQQTAHTRNSEDVRITFICRTV